MPVALNYTNGLSNAWSNVATFVPKFVGNNPVGSYVHAVIAYLPLVFAADAYGAHQI